MRHPTTTSNLRPLYFFFPAKTLFKADLSTFPAFSISFLVNAAVTQILKLGRCSIISCAQFLLDLVTNTPFSAHCSTTSCNSFSCSSRVKGSGYSLSSSRMQMWIKGDISAEGISIGLTEAKILRNAATLSGSGASGCAGEVMLAGMESIEMASDAETARSGGRAAENTKPGELILCEFKLEIISLRSGPKPPVELKPFAIEPTNMSTSAVCGERVLISAP
ncbi:BZ3500_MvSof-1268-A1-R1_Chr2-1g04521 [Microbotryum saponariae]|uniref:BZ3500_MvSof-1268-A1-R1_Chr2-1g04521 protein n=1 Tax=Microbotryum saponariae TaxID=289078 RepID=A0A2X0MCL5_9BASI|nr:BZ3500_MvSof-1268-A1-R1_Chr2-1g04521 [Microbotryum saponariae]SCZ91910.1 BZ3501_MvSof-1269-A2-R1_Chr2-1g04177 [Microbotryum saponariae]